MLLAVHLFFTIQEVEDCDGIGEEAMELTEDKEETKEEEERRKVVKELTVDNEETEERRKVKGELEVTSWPDTFSCSAVLLKMIR